MNFLYFLPGASAAGEKTLAAAGLAEIFAGGPVAQRRILNTGPGGGAGLLLAPTDGPIDFQPRLQTWSPVPGPAAAGRPWLGYTTADPPIPADLVRGEPLDGYGLQLGGEGPAGPQRYTVPKARYWPEGSALPEALALGPDGALVREPLRRFAALSALADEIAREVYQDAPGRDDADAYATAVRILAVNYRLGPGECSALRLFETGTLFLILACFVDWPAWKAQDEAARALEAGQDEDPTAAPADGPMAEAKKNAEPDAEHMNSGPADS